jgi:hypothetical protein
MLWLPGGFIEIAGFMKDFPGNCFQFSSLFLGFSCTFFVVEKLLMKVHSHGNYCNETLHA